MKIKLEKIRQIIREELIREQSSKPNVELTDNPSPREVSDAWPDRVFHNGNNVFKTFYGDNAADAHDWLSREGYEGQEVYLGYDPQSDNFVMGFDAFYEGGPQSYDAIDNFDSEMEGVFILLDPRGRALETISSIPGGVYGGGKLRGIRTALPQIIDIRLD